MAEDPASAAEPVFSNRMDFSAAEYLRATSAPELVEPPGPPLPDDGPRLEEGLRVQGILDLAWEEGRVAYQKGAWSEAGRFFQKIVRDYPDSHLVPAALAFLAEVALREDASVRDRTAAIQLYKQVLRDHPRSSNAGRAAWRIADLYREQGWLQEAQSYYEQAMARSLDVPFDSHRALLGLGYTFMAMRKWSDAEHAFSTLRKRTDHELLSQYATVGLAHAVYRQQRLAEARVFYDLCYRRWPALFRRDPLAIQRYAVTQAVAHRDVFARELFLLLYNLYPRHEFAPAALLYVADGLAGTSNLPLATFFYSHVSSMYPHSVHSTVATMRRASLYMERRDRDDDWLKLAVDAMMRKVQDPETSEPAYLAMLREIADQKESGLIGAEALVHLGKYYEKKNDVNRALLLYKDAVLRADHVDIPWASQALERISTFLIPWIERAIKSGDDLTVVSLFHRYGVGTGQTVVSPPLLIEIAEAHRRLGFATEAGRLYQELTKVKDQAVLESALVGLGKSYLEQEDPTAARKVFERYRFQFQAGRYESEVLHLLVTAMRRQGDLESVLRLCRQWLQHHPRGVDRPYMVLQLAEVLGELKQWEESAAAYETVLKGGGKPSFDVFLAYAETLSRLNRHEQAIAAYHAALDQHPGRQEREWIHLQTARHWNELRQYDRATVALAEVGETDDPLINRFVASLKDTVRTGRRLEMKEKEES
ncbi:MAG: tetratricopeptide repeat protein [Nitrospira sp.]|nr:tetratricopeptide repeat protein [Nitrospira sp.]MCP9443529.1 tetratricopeptide repeat protein [Nitrospira sp.]